MNARRLLLWTALGAAAAVFAGMDVASAAKPPKPPPPPPVPVDTGIVYFTRLGITNSMNPDGSAKSALPAGVDGVPSRTLHGGHRWFLTMRNIAGETYPGSAIARREVFAVRDDALVVTQLTLQPDLMASTAIRWAPGDTEISWAAQRWVDGVMGTSGIYRSTLLYDVDGNVTGLDSQPASPAVPMENVWDHDWSPDGARLVVVSGSALRLVELSSGVVTSLPTSVAASAPAWSPDGTRIAFKSGATIRSVAAAGSGETTIFPQPSNSSTILERPRWSPHGTHLVFNLTVSGRYDVLRVASGGGATTNLTAELNTIPSGGNAALLQDWR